jgi:cold shock CspA family protein
MLEIIDDFSPKSEAIVSSLFVPKTEAKVSHKQVTNWQPGSSESTTEDEFHQSTILSLKEGYGFIKYPPNNVFFHFSSLIDYDFNELEIGDSVSFSLEPKEDGRMMAKEVFVVEQ